VPPSVADSLLAASELGPFFTIARAAARDASQRWRPLAQLGTADGREVLAAQLTVTGALLGTEERRTIASILQLGAAAALCSPLLAVAALEGYVPALTPENVDFCYPTRGPMQLMLNDTVPASTKADLLPELADQLISVALNGLLAPFTEALTAVERLPEQTLAGNAFSSLAAAARLIEPWAAGRRARALVDLMARRSPLLAGAGDLHWQQPGDDPHSRREYFRRRNCCLFYRIPGAGTCGDCILD
jgi:ferric iron reductase protein FhuF